MQSKMKSANPTKKKAKISAFISIMDTWQAGPKKILCELKETALKGGKSDKSKSACTGIDNREVCGYGAGYEPIPVFEGGVGMNSIISIFRRYGYKVVESHGKRYDSYELELKKEEE